MSSSSIDGSNISSNTSSRHKQSSIIYTTCSSSSGGSVSNGVVRDDVLARWRPKVGSR